MDSVMKNMVMFMIVLAIAGTLTGAVLVPRGTTGETAVPENSAEWGGIQVWTDPANAYVTAESPAASLKYGQWSDNSGSATLSVEPYHWYTVTVTRDGYSPYSQTVWVDATNWAVVNADL